MPALASDLAGDPLWDSLPLPDLELNSNELDELNELDRLPLDPRPDAELSPEEEALDCDHCGEGDFVHLRLEGEHTMDGELGGRSHKGSVSVSLRDLSGCCGGGGGLIYPHCSNCPALCTADDDLLQNILGLSVAVKRWSVRKIQAVKPQPRLCIGLGRKPANDG